MKNMFRQARFESLCGIGMSRSKRGSEREQPGETPCEKIRDSP